MANQVKTRIVLRNDEIANWEKSEKTLLQGEVALARTTDGKVEVRVGNGKAYKEALPLQISANQVLGLEGELASLSSTHYEVGSFADLEAKTGLNAGDTGVVKEQIADTGKYTYTAYVYDGEKWAAMDGNYNAENVYFTNDITLAGKYTTVGNITKAENGTGMLSAKGKSVKDIMMEIFTKKLQPSKIDPSVNLTFSEAKPYEVGTKVTPEYTASLNAGSYTYGPDTGVTATGWSVTDGTATKTTATGSFDELTVADNMNYRLTATATHTEGAVAKDNLGNDSDPVMKIDAGSKSRTSNAITGYRNSFYGTKTDKNGAVDSAYIRSLTKSSGKALANGNTFGISIPVGAMRVVFAYPAKLRDVSSVKDSNGLNAEIKSAFTKSTVSVEGANGYEAIEYKVYMTDFANPVDKANTYTVTI